MKTTDRNFNHRLITLFSLLIVLGMFLGGLPVQPALAAQIDDHVAGFAAGEVQRGKHDRPHLSSNLRDLADAAGQERAGIAAADPDIQVEANRIKVMLIMLDAASADAALQPLADLGGTITAHYKTWIDAWLPIDQLDQAARLPGVSIVRTPLWTTPSEEPQDEQADIGIMAGSTTTGGVQFSNADVWHRAQYQGQGIRVAVLENGGNGGFRDYQMAQASGDLPAQIQLYSGPAGDVPVEMFSNHGTKAAEIIHDMAPSAQLIFASPRTGAELAQFIVDLAQNHQVDVFSASLSLSGFSPGDGTGPVADAIAEAFHTYGALYVQAAGNQAQAHWDGVFTDTNNDGIHEFAPGDTTNNVCTTNPILLRWNDWPVSDNDFDLYLLQENSDGTTVVIAASTNPQTGTQPPVEFIRPTINTCYGLQIVARDIDRSRSHVLNIWTGDVELQHKVSQRSLLETATSDETIAVAAVSQSNNTRMFYSSIGPTHGPGGSLAGGKAQPRIAAYTEQLTSQGKMGGTSGSAPHVAGAAALMMQRFNRDAELVKQELELRAQDNGPAGYDFEYGYGVLQMRSPCELGDIDEPNDDPGFSGAQPTGETTPLEVNDFTHGGWLCPVNDQDWFWFSATPGSTYVIEASNQAADTNARLRLELQRKRVGQPIELLATDDAGRNETASIEYVPTEAGIYLVRVRDVNGLGVQNYRYEVSVRTRGAPAPLDFTHGFEGVDYLIPAFTARTSGSGRVRVTGDHGPFEGTRHLVLDSGTSSKRSAAEVTLYLDTGGYRELTLTLRQREYADEANPLANQYSVSNPDDPNQGMFNGDGVAVSFDGGFTWYRIIDLSGGLSSNSWRLHTIDLDQQARNHGETIGPQTRIRFHHYETESASAAPLDGFAFDNIAVTGTR